MHLSHFSTWVQSSVEARHTLVVPSFDPEATPLPSRENLAKNIVLVCSDRINIGFPEGYDVSRTAFAGAYWEEPIAIRIPMNRPDSIRTSFEFWCFMLCPCKNTSKARILLPQRAVAQSTLFGWEWTLWTCPLIFVLVFARSCLRLGPLDTTT